jgi:hypothetical protein
MTNKECILEHIQASAPCSLFSVALWADSQLTIGATGFSHMVDVLISSKLIEVTTDECGLVVDLI